MKTTQRNDLLTILIESQGKFLLPQKTSGALTRTQHCSILLNNLATYVKTEKDRLTLSRDLLFQI